MSQIPALTLASAFRKRKSTGLTGERDRRIKRRRIREAALKEEIERARSRRTVPEDVSLMARFADSAYKDIQERVVSIPLSERDQWSYLEHLSSEEVAVWQHADESQIITSHRGTANFSDVGTDVALVLGIEEQTDRFKRANEHYERILQEFPPDEYSHTLVGHSLGGAINEYIFSKHYNEIDRVHNFNPGAAFAEMTEKLKFLTRRSEEERALLEARGDKVANHHIEGDPISTLKRLDPTTIVYDKTYSDKMAHTISQFY